MTANVFLVRFSTPILLWNFNEKNKQTQTSQKTHIQFTENKEGCYKKNDWKDPKDPEFIFWREYFSQDITCIYTPCLEELWQSRWYMWDERLVECLKIRTTLKLSGCQANKKVILYAIVNKCKTSQIDTGTHRHKCKYAIYAIKSLRYLNFYNEYFEMYKHKNRGQKKGKMRKEKTPQGIILYNPQSGTFYKIPDWSFQVKKAQ